MAHSVGDDDSDEYSSDTSSGTSTVDLEPHPQGYPPEAYTTAIDPETGEKYFKLNKAYEKLPNRIPWMYAKIFAHYSCFVSVTPE